LVAPCTKFTHLTFLSCLRPLQASSSMLYSKIWQELCSEEAQRDLLLQVREFKEEEGGDVDDAKYVEGAAGRALVSWTGTVDECLRRWRDVITSLDTVSYKRLADLLHGLLVNESVSLSFDGVVDKLTIDRLITKHNNEALPLHRSKVLEAEARTTFKVLEGITTANEETMRNFLLEFAAACDMHAQCVHTVRMLAEGEAKADAVQKLALHDVAGYGSAKGAVVLLRQVKHEFEGIQNIAIGFPMLLAEAVDSGLPDLCRSYVSTQELMHAIDRKLDERGGEKEQDLLNAFLTVRRGFASEETYDRIFRENRGIFRDTKFLVDFLQRVSFCVQPLQRIVGKLDVLQLSLAGGGGGNSLSAAITAELLMQQSTVFALDFSAGAREEVTLHAQTTSTRNGRYEAKSFSITEINDIPFQLCLEGDQPLQTQRESNKALQRTRSEFTARFLDFHETLTSLVRVARQLVVVGHPNYQSCTMRFPGDTTLLDLQEQVQRLAGELEDWQSFLTNNESDVPLATFLNRKQVVECLSLLNSRGGVGSPNLYALMRSVYPVLSWVGYVRFVCRTIYLHC
jgi:hypothetical protein